MNNITSLFWAVIGGIVIFVLKDVYGYYRKRFDYRRNLKTWLRGLETSYRHGPEEIQIFRDNLNSDDGYRIFTGFVYHDLLNNLFDNSRNVNWREFGILTQINSLNKSHHESAEFYNEKIIEAARTSKRELIQNFVFEREKSLSKFVGMS